MKIKEIANLLNARVICGENHLENEVEFAFSSDLMSDVLTVDKSKFLLITGMVNIQAIRTAEMSDTQSILFVRNKKVSSEMTEIARQNDMVVMEYSGSMFKASGILFSAGLKPVY